MTNNKITWRDVSGSGGYQYRQWDNGDIAILSGSLPAGWTLDQPGPRDAAWSSITAEIGSYSAEIVVPGDEEPFYKNRKYQIAAGAVLLSGLIWFFLKDDE
jgi:hypothetical protein